MKFNPRVLEPVTNNDHSVNVTEWSHRSQRQGMDSKQAAEPLKGRDHSMGLVYDERQSSNETQIDQTPCSIVSMCEGSTVGARGEGVTGGGTAEGQGPRGAQCGDLMGCDEQLRSQVEIWNSPSSVFKIDLHCVLSRISSV